MKTSFIDNYFNQNPNTFNPLRRRPEVKDMAIPTKAQTIKKTAKFEVVYEMDGSSFEVDKTNGIARIIWKGNVNIKTAKHLVIHCARAIEKGNKKLLIDQSTLDQFDTEARLWIKVFIKSSIGNVSSKLLMLASIKPKSTKGSIFSHFASSELKEALPNLDMRRFDAVEEALDWLL
ncbi:hypothetical protein [Ekhidna sp.]|uniref:hypothetical protein n=1 Tax=Ekhidna sp. TaxID=2608089 RepID=UPI0032EF49E2